MSEYIECDICVENGEEEPNEGHIEYGKGANGYICQDCYENEIDMSADFDRDVELDR